MKKKQKAKKIHHRLTFWLGVLVLGMLVGASIQFGRAWVEPSLNAPDGNIAAPINTGATKQVKQGDICTTVTGTEICLSGVVSFPKCTLAGGVPMTVGTSTICKFPGGSCPTGWSQYLKYSETTANTCTGSGGCGTSITSGSHLFNNIDPTTEAKNYYDGTQTSWDCGYSQDIDGRCCCWWPCYGTYWVSQTCTTCSQTLHICMPNITFVGCVAN